MSASPPASSSSSLLDIAHLIDDCLAEDPADVAFYVLDDPTELVLGVRTLERHPCAELADLRAGHDWRAFGVRVRATAHFLDGSGGAEPVTTTFVLDRAGASVSVLRRGDRVSDDCSPARGRVPDLCRRILSSPRDDAPSRS